MSKSLAAVFMGNPGEAELHEIPLPFVEQGEMLVRVLGCTICGSDLHSFDGRRTVPTPTILGHEIVGEIVEFGAATERQDITGREICIGDRVTWAIVASCGQCAMCDNGLPQKCLNAVKYGHEAFRPGKELLGGLSEYCLLVRGTSVVRLPEELPLEVACPASCATATIMAAVESAGAISGKSFCLFGAGMLGLTACAVLHANGAASIMCVDPIASRRELAKQFGATQIAAPEQVADLASRADGGLGFDVILELSGSNHAFESSWPLLRTGGALILVGSVFPATPVEVSLEQVVKRHLTIRGVHNYAPYHLQLAVAFLARHFKDYPFSSLVSTWMPLSSVLNAFEASKQASCIRIGVHP
jgi:putative phosphonate catabolism associated alcohol dehydrogenase